MMVYGGMEAKHLELTCGSERSVSRFGSSTHAHKPSRVRVPVLNERVFEGKLCLLCFLLRHSCKNAFVLRDPNVVSTLSV